MDYVEEQLIKIRGYKSFETRGYIFIWIDYRETGFSEKEMMDLLLTDGKLALEPGTKYGEAGEGFLR